ncbi:hypothetical protein [Metabacillus sp. FJAT-53654]|uniref:DUF5678 domain-containing protein n=1 Tax=Metabacillus rhizosphaerae TaxID=3117747 RepID=A0ABZ2MNP8_9BACI
MIKSHYSIGSKVIIFIKGTELQSPQTLAAVQDLALGFYKGAYPEVLVIAEDNSSRIFVTQ